MFADTLLQLERAHLLRLLIWGAGSTLAGTLLLALQALQRTTGSPLLLRHFAIQTAAWGAIDVALALWGQHGVAIRDYAAARQLDRVLWLNLGLDGGYVGVGITLALCGWLFGRRAAPVGAGVGVIVQGLALFLLDLLFVRQLQASV